MSNPVYQATVPKACPFCGQPISPAQYSTLRERLKKAEDPALIKELDHLRADLETDIRSAIEAEYKPLRRKLDDLQQREREFAERAANLALKEASMDADVAKKVQAKERELISAGEKKAKEKFDLLAKAKDAELASLKEALVLKDEGIDAQVATKLQEKEKVIRLQEQQRAETKYSAVHLKLREYEERELEFEKAKEAVALREQAVELDLRKRVAAERDSILKQAGEQAKETYLMELKEKDGAIELLRKRVAEMQEQLQMGSAQSRGYIQQHDIAEALKISTQQMELKRSRGENAVQMYFTRFA